MMVLVFAVPLYDLLSDIVVPIMRHRGIIKNEPYFKYASSTVRPQASVSDNNMKDTSCLT